MTGEKANRRVCDATLVPPEAKIAKPRYRAPPQEIERMAGSPRTIIGPLAQAVVQDRGGRGSAACA